MHIYSQLGCDVICCYFLNRIFLLYMSTFAYCSMIWHETILLFPGLIQSNYFCKTGCAQHRLFDRRCLWNDSLYVQAAFNVRTVDMWTETRPHTSLLPCCN